MHILYLYEMYETAEWVQVQYPDALQTMLTDLRSIRNWAGYLQKTEIKFDMVSAVDELAKQVSLLLHAPSIVPHAKSVLANIACLPKREDVVNADSLMCRLSWSLTSSGRQG